MNKLNARETELVNAAIGRTLKAVAAEIDEIRHEYASATAVIEAGVAGRIADALMAKAKDYSTL